MLELHGFGELGRKLNVMSRAGQWAEMTREIFDDVVRSIAAVGTIGDRAQAMPAAFTAFQTSWG